jgi:hypothetical protein
MERGAGIGAKMSKNSTSMGFGPKKGENKPFLAQKGKKRV